MRRLSSPSDDEYVPNSNTRGMEGEEALGTHGSGDGSAAVDAVEDIQESSQQVGLRIHGRRRDFSEHGRINKCASSSPVQSRRSQCVSLHIYPERQWPPAVGLEKPEVGPSSIGATCCGGVEAEEPNIRSFFNSRRYCS